MSDEVGLNVTVYVIASISSSKFGRELAWNFFKENWKLFIDRLEGPFLFVRVVKPLTKNFASEEKAVEIENFFKVGKIELVSVALS